MKDRYYRPLTSFALLALFFLCLSSFTFAQSNLSVKQAVTEGLAKNPGLSEIQARYEALREIPSQFQSLPDPIVSVGGSEFPYRYF